MEQEKNKIKSGWNKYLTFSLILFCFLFIPASILFYSVYRYFQIEEEQLIFNLNSHVQRMGNELKRNLSAEEYFCRYFHEYVLSEINNPNSTASKTAELLQNIKKYYGKGIDFVIINNKGNILYNTTDFNHEAKEYLEAYLYVRYHYSEVSEHRKKGRCPDIEATRKILGPQVVSDSFQNLQSIAYYSQTYYSLLWVDSGRNIPPSGVYCLRWGGFFVFISENLLKSFKHLRQYADKYGKDNKLISGIYDYRKINDDFWCNSDEIDTAKVKEALVKSETSGNRYVETENYYICHQFLSRDIRAFLLIEKKNTDLNIFLKALLAFLIYFFLSFPLIKYIWNTVILKIPGNASIRLKLAFLFFFATAIPILSLTIVSHEYNLHRRMALIEEARLWSIENLLGIEQRFMSYLKNIVIDLDKYVDEWSEKLKKEELNNEHGKLIGKKLDSLGAYDFYCCASESKIIATFEGLFKYTGSLEAINIDKKNSVFNSELYPYRCDELKVVNIITKKLCSDLNGKEIPSYILSKVEILAENIVQKTFPEIVYEAVETIGTIKEWGLGKNTSMAYFKFISLFGKNQTDYILISSWRPRQLQESFIKSIIDKANRNPKNFKFIAYERFYRQFVQSKYEKFDELRHFAKEANEKPTEELQIINLDGEDYIAVCFTGRELYRYSFVGLYPLSNVDRTIDEQSSMLWILIILCIVLAIGLAQLLTKSFVKPLLTLQEGALAIESRNFTHRLSLPNRDEFGEVGNIFNKVMVGLEELEIAKIVQESMFPKPEFNQGKFSIYGKTVTMRDVGGDYIDFFKVDGNSFSMLIGDVAGHGVGAAVIMAMAKAAVLGGGEELRSPALMLNNLHKMILATKSSKQKKIMTFQYLHINSETAQLVYGNAGGCSPWLVRHKIGIIEELKMSGAALGAFKKASYREMPIYMQPGDAIVFYTDGIIESKNKSGEMLGYNRFKLLLQSAWDKNPEKYYNNIYGEYINHVGIDAEADDDLTIAILVYNETEEEKLSQEILPPPN